MTAAKGDLEFSRKRGEKEYCDFCYFSRISRLGKEHGDINRWNFTSSRKCICSTDIWCKDDTCFYYTNLFNRNGVPNRPKNPTQRSTK